MMYNFRTWKTDQSSVATCYSFWCFHDGMRTAVLNEPIQRLNVLGEL